MGHAYGAPHSHVQVLRQTRKATLEHHVDRCHGATVLGPADF